MDVHVAGRDLVVEALGDDPYVTFTDGMNASTTNICQDTVACTFTKGSLVVPAADIIAGKVTFLIGDEDDVTGNDTCGSGQIQIAGPLTVGSYKETFKGTPMEFDFRIDAAP